MCKLEGTKWAVVKSNKKISNSLFKKLVKARYGFREDNVFSFYFFTEEDFSNIVEILKSYKKQKFEIVRFYDKQFGLTQNHWVSSVSNKDYFEEKVTKLPLSHRFNWFDNSNRISVTPITKKQFENIIRIN